MMITTEAGVAEAPKKKDAGHSHGVPGRHGYVRRPPGSTYERTAPSATRQVALSLLAPVLHSPSPLGNPLGA